MPQPPYQHSILPFVGLLFTATLFMGCGEKTGPVVIHP